MYVESVFLNSQPRCGCLVTAPCQNPAPPGNHFAKTAGVALRSCWLEDFGSICSCANKCRMMFKVHRNILSQNMKGNLAICLAPSKFAAEKAEVKEQTSWCLQENMCSSKLIQLPKNRSELCPYFEASFSLWSFFSFIPRVQVAVKNPCRKT